MHTVRFQIKKIFCILFVHHIYSCDGCFPLVILKLNCGSYDMLLFKKNSPQYPGIIKLGVVRSIPVSAGMITSNVKSFLNHNILKRVLVI